MPKHVKKQMQEVQVSWAHIWVVLNGKEKEKKKQQDKEEKFHNRANEFSTKMGECAVLHL